jgi:hypothetical protein
LINNQGNPIEEIIPLTGLNDEATGISEDKDSVIWISTHHGSLWAFDDGEL